MFSKTPWTDKAPEIDGTVDRNYREISGGCGYMPDEPDGEAGFRLIGFVSPQDARLLSSAPEMYLALKAIETFGKAPQAVLDAIAKAEGRA